MALRRAARLFRLAIGRPTGLADADAELDLHVELLTEELIAKGVAPEVARRRALATLGDRRRIRSELAAIDGGRRRESRRREAFAGFRRDLRQAVRSLARDPWFTGGAAAILVLAIGLNGVIFSALNAAFLRPLPYPAAGRIVRIYEVDRSGRRMQVAAPNADDWRRLSRSVEHLAIFADADAVLVDGDEPEYVHAAAVGRELIEVLGVTPLAGRWIAPEEAIPGGPVVAVIAEGLWRRRYGGRPDAIGRTVTLDGLSATIIGVLPAEATFPNGAQVWISAERAGDPGTRTAHNWQVVARLRPGVSRAAAESELTTLTGRIMASFPASDFAARSAAVVSLRESLLGGQRSLLVILQAAALTILAIVAVNLTNLLLVRSVRQRTEVAVRTALGASSRHLIRRSLLEAIVLTTASGAIGLAAAFPFRSALYRLLVRFVPLLPPLVIDYRVMAVGLVGSALVGAAAAVVPAHRAARENPNHVLGGTGAGRVLGHHPIMNGLIAIEIALALVLLVGAGLLVRSLINLSRVDVGFDPVGRVVARLPSDFASPTDTTPPAFTVAGFDRLLAAVRATASVARVGLTLAVPLNDPGTNATLEIAGQAAPPGESPSAGFRIVSPGFFETMGIPIEAGRDFTGADDLRSPRLVIVNRTFVRRYLVGRDPIGVRIRFVGLQRGEEPWGAIAGVVGDVRHRSLDRPADPEVYYTYRQRPPTARNTALVVLARNGTDGVLADLRAILRQEAPAAPFRAFPLEASMAEVLGVPRMRSSVLVLFALLAVALAAVGIFGVVAFTVAQRTREIGLRLALGSARGAATRSAMGLVLGPVAAGLGLGLAGALLVGRLVRGLLFDTGPLDPVALGLALIAMAGVSLVASWLPARRAAGIDPAVSLRA